MADDVAPARSYKPPSVSTNSAEQARNFCRHIDRAASAAEGEEDGGDEQHNLQNTPGQRGLRHVAPKRAALAMEVFIPVDFVRFVPGPVGDRV